MKFLFDHDVPDDLSYLLLQLGHQVSLLRQLLPKDASDPAVFQFAYDNHFLLVTCNRDEAYEVEFVTLDGHTAAVATLETSQLRPVGRRDITHSRELSTV